MNEPPNSEEMNLPASEPSDEFSVWAEVLVEAARDPAVILILGGMDVGKTTFTRLLANRIVNSGTFVSLLDADTGQSELGPPGTIGLATIKTPVVHLSGLTPIALRFTGSTTPSNSLLEHLTATRRLLDLAEQPVLIDTPGYIVGPGGQRFLHGIIELVNPTTIIGLQRNAELEIILEPLRRRGGVQVLTAGRPEVLIERPASIRTRRREAGFARVFSEARLHNFSFDNVTFAGTWLGSGTPLPAHLLRFAANQLSRLSHVYYGELQGGHLGLMVSRPLPAEDPAIAAALEDLKAAALSVTVTSRLKYLLVGLEDSAGMLLGIGRIESIDFRRRILGIMTSVPSPHAARTIRFGFLQVTLEGKELGNSPAAGR